MKRSWPQGQAWEPLIWVESSVHLAVATREEDGGCMDFSAPRTDILGELSNLEHARHRQRGRQVSGLQPGQTHTAHNPSK